MRSLVRAAAAVLAVLVFTIPAAAQIARDVVVVGMEAEPPGLDPGQALGLHTLRVTAQLFETLVATPDDSGRYRFETWERGTRLVLKRNDDYWGAKGKPQTLVYRAIPDATTRVTELLTGGVDLILPIAPDFIDKLEKNSQVTVYRKTG